jgi:hypothetical protein
MIDQGPVRNAVYNIDALITALMGEEKEAEGKDELNEMYDGLREERHEHIDDESHPLFLKTFLKSVQSQE